MKLFFAYLKAAKKKIFLSAVCALTAAVVLRLFQLPLPPIFYTLALCAFLGLMAMILQFRQFRKKHLLLQTLAKQNDLAADRLPIPDNQLEEDYLSLIRRLIGEKEDLSEEIGKKYGAMIDYYTLWTHQIKTPIAAMKLILQNREQPDPELSEELMRIEQYVEMILGYLRLDANETDYMIAKYDLDSIIRQAVRKYASQFIRRKIRLEYQPVNTTVLTDEKWLLFVLEQVLQNALQYTPKGAVTIAIEAPKTLIIRDTGIGIAPEDLPRVFEKGYTGYNGRKEKKASGIGLYLCRRICQNLGHTISAASSESGTEIRIEPQHRELQIE